MTTTTQDQFTTEQAKAALEEASIQVWHAWLEQNAKHALRYEDFCAEFRPLHEAVDQLLTLGRVAVNVRVRAAVERYVEDRNNMAPSKLEDSDELMEAWSNLMTDVWITNQEEREYFELRAWQYETGENNEDHDFDVDSGVEFIMNHLRTRYQE